MFDKPTVEISVIKLALMCDAMGLAKTYMAHEVLKKNLDTDNLTKEAKQAIIISIGFFIGLVEFRHIIDDYKESTEFKESGIDMEDIMTHYSALMAKDTENVLNNAPSKEHIAKVLKDLGYEIEDLNLEVDNNIAIYRAEVSKSESKINSKDQKEIDKLDKLWKQKPYEKN
tara:strand:- start:3884 stop:4396 length:513 start_codon:yes stop_codon:yes gene_type:complete